MEVFDGYQWVGHIQCTATAQALLKVAVLYDLQFTPPPPVVFFTVLGRRETALPHMFDAAVCTYAAMIVNGAAPSASSVQNKQVTRVIPLCALRGLCYFLWLRGRICFR